MSYSYVIGNAWHVNLLTLREREFLDKADNVFVINNFFSSWKKANFRPTHYVVVDTYGEGAKELKIELEAILDCVEIRKRLKHIIIGIRSLDAVNYLTELLPKFYPNVNIQNARWDDITITLCHSYVARRSHLAKTFSERLYNHGSTITTAINAAMILAPDSVVKFCACPYNDGPCHFYDELENKSNRHAPAKSGGGTYHHWMHCMWEGLEDIYRQNPKIIDCNLGRGPDKMNEYNHPPIIPVGTLIDGYDPDRTTDEVLKKQFI